MFLWVILITEIIRNYSILCRFRNTLVKVCLEEPLFGEFYRQLAEQRSMIQMDEDDL